MQCDQKLGVMVTCMYRALVWGCSVGGVAFLACDGGLAVLMHVRALRGFPALVSDCLCMPNHHVS